LDLDPPSDWLSNLTTDLEGLINLAGNNLNALQINALLKLRTSSDARLALQAAESWVQSEADNPSAYLCRFRCQLRLWDLEGAQEDAVLAFQYAIEPGPMRRRISSLISVALDAQQSLSQRESWEAFHREFSDGVN